MAADPSQNAKSPGRIARLLRRSLLGSPTGHPVLVSFYAFIMNRFVNLSRLRLRALLDPFAKIKTRGGPGRITYPLREVLFLVCGTIASGDDYNDIVDWGNAHCQAMRIALNRATAGERGERRPTS
jgi:hypothetical protein